MSTPSTPEPQGISWVGKVLMLYFSALFGVEVLMPWILVLFNVSAPDEIGDANTRAVLTNLVIAIMSYIVGRNEGSRQAEQNISKLVDTAKTVATTAAATVASTVSNTAPGVDGAVDLKLKEGDTLNVEAVPDPEKK